MTRGIQIRSVMVWIAGLLTACAGAPPPPTQPPTRTTTTAPVQTAASVPPAPVAGLLNSDRVIVGEGDCRTLRHAVYQRNGFVEIEIDRPYSGRCGFTDLALVIDDIAVPGPAAMSASIKTNDQGVRYWADRRGTLFFKYGKPLDPSLLKERARFGLAQPVCGWGERCLTDAGLLLAKIDVGQLLQEGAIRAALESDDDASLLKTYSATKDPRVLEALLRRTGQENTVERALSIHGVESSPKALALAQRLALEGRRVDSLLKVHAINKRRELLSVAHDAATTDAERAQVELLVMQSLQDKLFDFKATLAGTGRVDANDSNVVIARVVETKLRALLSFSGQLRTDIYAPRFDYAVDGVLILVAHGVQSGERNCGFLWGDKCEIKDEPTSRSFEYPVSLVFSRNGQYRVSGSRDIEWKSISGGSGAASGLLMGGTRVFKADGRFDMQFQVKSLKPL